jgi:signal transduction histidine kinase
MAQVETGTYQLVDEEIDLAATLTAIFRLVQGRAAQAGLFLQARLPKDLPRLMADAKAFKQIVVNLLNNAIKFTNPGGRIYVLAALLPEGDLTLRVVDSGIGISERDIPRILLPFERVGEALTRKEQGAGLGLALVHGLVVLHGGTLVLQSKVGVGTVATVTFPRARLRPGSGPAGPKIGEAAAAGGSRAVSLTKDG